MKQGQIVFRLSRADLAAYAAHVALGAACDVSYPAHRKAPLAQKFLDYVLFESRPSLGQGEPVSAELAANFLKIFQRDIS